MNRKYILPRWALVPLAAVLIVNMAVYTLTGVLVSVSSPLQISLSPSL